MGESRYQGIRWEGVKVEGCIGIEGGQSQFMVYNEKSGVKTQTGACLVTWPHHSTKRFTEPHNNGLL